MTKILLVDDDASLLKLLSDYLTRLGYQIITADDGETALKMVADDLPDLVLLDVRMPGLDGWQILGRMHEIRKVPTIMLTALGEEPDVLKGFAMGADDYVSKPFSFAQLAARISAVLQRASPEGNGTHLHARDLVVDLDAHRVHRSDVPVALTPTEFKLLVALMRHPGRVFTPRQLVTQVWGLEYADATDYIRRYVWHLRQKIEPDPRNARYIHNERGVGYFFSASQ